MSNKAISKFWIEIIGGVIIVVIVLLVFLMFSSAITTGVEDAANKQSFVHFTQLIAKANREGEEAVAPFVMKTSTSNRVYAITFISPSIADCMYNYSSKGNPTDNDLIMCPHKDGHPIHPSFKLDGLSKIKLKKCTSTSLQGKGDVTDICLCLIRADYKNSFGGLGPSCQPFYNIIGYDVNNLAGSVHDPKSAYDDITYWINDSLEQRLFSSNKVYNVKVLECSLMKDDIGCYVNENGVEYPCVIAFAPKDSVFRGIMTDWFGGISGGTGAKPVLMYWFGCTNVGPINLDVMTAKSNNIGLVYIYPYDNKHMFLFPLRYGSLSWSARGNDPIGVGC